MPAETQGKDDFKWVTQDSVSILLQDTVRKKKYIEALLIEQSNNFCRSPQTKPVHLGQDFAHENS